MHEQLTTRQNRKTSFNLLVTTSVNVSLYEFHYINENKNWTEAQQYCRENHTDLATVTNMKDMKRLINILPEGWRGAWIGLYYQTDGNRKWHWSVPGLEFNESETNWNRGEPDDKTGQHLMLIKTFYMHVEYLHNQKTQMYQRMSIKM
uniref:C-type lectin domain-containing protein n=1 Tax=Xiphophorus maculatus TaxID=8083 RepID=A0A3B5QBJ1_XIPMA